MNNDICPSGTWDWLAHLGYSRADVERIVEQRRNMEVLGRQIVENLRQADAVAERMITNDILEAAELAVRPPMFPERSRELSRVPLYRNGENDDAELMSKDEIIRRREEGMNLWWTQGQFLFRGDVQERDLI